MKKSILVLFILLIPVLAIAQTAEDYFDKGVAKYEQGDYRGAIQDYNKAIELDPNDHMTYGVRVLAKSKLGDYRGAIEDYNKAIELLGKTNLTDPLDKLLLGEYYYNRGVTKSDLGDYRVALQDFNKAIELNPKLAEAYGARGLSKIKLGQKDSGCLDLSKAGEMGYMKVYDVIKEFCQ